MNKIAKIIPYKKMPRKFGQFDYLIPEELIEKVKLGSLVKIPFKKQTITGLVTGFSHYSKFKYIKPVKNLVLETEAEKWQLEFIKWFSLYYCCSEPTAFKLIFPDLPKIVREYKVKKIDSQKIKLPNNGWDKQKIAEQIFCSKTEKKYLLMPHSFEEKCSFYLNLCKSSIKENKQILFIFPRINQINYFLKLLSDDLKNQVLIVSSDIQNSKNAQINTWKKIKKNEKKIIIGTRLAVFMPFSTLKLVVVDQAHSQDLKQWDQNPRYDSGVIAEKLCQLLNCGLIISSITPTLKQAYKAKTEKHEMIKIPKGSSIKTNLIDIKKQRQSEFTYLSFELEQLLKQKLSQNKKSLLIVNRRGEYTYFFCRDCGWEALCDECGLPMVVEDKKLACHHCSKTTALPLQCPQCHNTNLKKLGAGLQQIKDLVSEKFQQKVGELTPETAFSPKEKICISTGQGLKTQQIAAFDFLGFVYIDSLVHLADFNSNYNLYSYLKNLINDFNSFSASKDKEVLLQTAFPENEAIKNVFTDYKEFYKNEIKLRKDFNYPPFSSLVKLIFEHHDKKIAEREAKSLFAELEEKKSKGIKLIPPYLYYAQKVRKRFRYQIVLFFSSYNYLEINRFLEVVPDHWAIDKDPLNLI